MLHISVVKTSGEGKPIGFISRLYCTKQSAGRWLGRAEFEGGCCMTEAEKFCKFAAVNCRWYETEQKCNYRLSCGDNYRNNLWPEPALRYPFDERRRVGGGNIVFPLCYSRIAAWIVFGLGAARFQGVVASVGSASVVGAVVFVEQSASL